MGVDVLLAVGLGVAVQQVFDAVEQRPDPGAVNHAFHLGAVFHQHAQQFGQVGGAPVAGNKALGKTDVAGFDGCATHIPVVQLDAGVWQGLAPETLGAAVRQLYGQTAVAQALAAA